MYRIHALSLASTLLILSSVSAAETIFVDGQRTTGNNDGTSWENAFRSPIALQDALATAFNGDEIWIAEGTYYATDTGDRFARFGIENNYSLHGGFRGDEASLEERPAKGLAPTILDGDLAGDDDLPGGSMDENTNRLMIIFDPARPTLDRLTFCSANARGASAAGSGAGILMGENSMPTIIDCTFTKNRARFVGSAIQATGTEATVVGCTFEENFAELGSPVFVAYDNVFSFDRCEFINNSGGQGGALTAVRQFVASGRCTISNCLFFGNSATGSEGRTIVGGANDNPQALALRMVNCTIADNQALGSDAAGVHIAAGMAEIENCIFWGNRGQSGSLATTVQFTGVIDLSRSIVEGGYAAGADIIDADPLFVDAANGDYAVLPSSPAIDSGANDALELGLVHDLVERRRFHDDPATPDSGVGTGPIIDLGANEFTDALGAVLCFPVMANSTGSLGTTDATGSLSAGANDFTLTAAKLPVGAIGFFCASRVSQLPVNPPGSLGILCLGGAIGRFVAPGEIQTVNSSGTFQIAVDLTQLPQPDQDVAAMAGDTWFFQAWHQDTSFFGATSNFTDVVRVTFLP